MNRSKKYVFFILLLMLAFCAMMPELADAKVIEEVKESKIVQARTLSQLLTNVYLSASTIPQLLSLFAYITGIMTIISGILKLKAHVDKPDGVPISSPIKTLIAGGALLALPYLSTVVVGTVLGIGADKVGEGQLEISGGGGAVAGEVDGMIYKFVSQIYGPMISLMSLFAYIAAIAFLIIGIRRLMNTEKEGPRGPSGIGTITTFLVSGALFAAGDMSTVFVSSLFGTDSVNTYPTIGDIVEEGDKTRIAAVISAIMAFVNMIGFIAFLRGWFVLKSVADGGGGGKATLAQAITFLIGGTIAINLGEFINILQATVGVEGITFD